MMYTMPGFDGESSDCQAHRNNDVLPISLDEKHQNLGLIGCSAGESQNFDLIPSLSFAGFNFCLPSVQNSSRPNCSSSSDLSTLGEEDDMIITKINQLRQTEKYDAQTANELIDVWKLFSEQSRHHQNILSMLPKLMSSTAEVLLAPSWKKISKEAQDLFQEYLLTTSTNLEAENEILSAKLCRNVVEMVRTDLWRPPHLQWMYEETCVPFEAAKTLWESEGCIFLETRLGMLCQGRAYDNAVLLAEACIMIGKHIQCNRGQTKESASLNPFDMDEDKLEEFGAVFVLILDQQDSEDEAQRFSPLKKYLSPSFCLKITEKLMSSGSPNRVAAKWKKGWKYGEDVAFQFLEIALPDFVKTTDVIVEELEELYSHWLTLYVKQSCDDEDQTSIEYASSASSIKLPDSKIENILKTAEKTDYVFALADCIIKKFPSNQMARSKCVDLYIPVLMTDINNFEKLKRNELKKDEQEESGHRLSLRYKNLANYFPEDNLTTFELLLTAFSLYPTQELLDKLTAAAEESSDITSSAVSSAEKARRLGLTELQYDDLVSVITNPRWARLNCFRSSWAEFKPLCLKHLETRGTNIKGLNDLELVTPDYAKYENLKPAYDEADGGYEPGYGPKMNGAYDEESDDEEGGRVPCKVREPSHRLKNLDKLNQSAQNRAEHLSKNHTYKNKLKRLMVGKPQPLQKLGSSKDGQNISLLKTPRPRGPTGAPRGRPRKNPLDASTPTRTPRRLPPVVKEQIRDSLDSDPLYYKRPKIGRPKSHVEGKQNLDDLSNMLPPSLPKWDAFIPTHIIPFLPIPFPPDEKSDLFRPSSEGGFPEGMQNWMVNSPSHAHTTATVCHSHGVIGSPDDDEVVEKQFTGVNTWELISQKKHPNLPEKGPHDVCWDRNYTNNENSWRHWMKFAGWDKNVTATDYDKAAVSWTKGIDTGWEHKQQKLQEVPIPTQPKLQEALPSPSSSPSSHERKRKRSSKNPKEEKLDTSIESTVAQVLRDMPQLQVSSVTNFKSPDKDQDQDAVLKSLIGSPLVRKLRNMSGLQASVSTHCHDPRVDFQDHPPLTAKKSRWDVERLDREFQEFVQSGECLDLTVSTTARTNRDDATCVDISKDGRMPSPRTVVADLTEGTSCTDMSINQQPSFPMLKPELSTKSDGIVEQPSLPLQEPEELSTIQVDMDKVPQQLSPPTLDPTTSSLPEIRSCLEIEKSSAEDHEIGFTLVEKTETQAEFPIDLDLGHPCVLPELEAVFDSENPIVNAPVMLMHANTAVQENLCATVDAELELYGRQYDIGSPPIEESSETLSLPDNQIDCPSLDSSQPTSFSGLLPKTDTLPSPSPTDKKEQTLEITLEIDTVPEDEESHPPKLYPECGRYSCSPDSSVLTKSEADDLQAPVLIPSTAKTENAYDECIFESYDIPSELSLSEDSTEMPTSIDTPLRTADEEKAVIVEDKYAIETATRRIEGEIPPLLSPQDNSSVMQVADEKDLDVDVDLEAPLLTSCIEKGNMTQSISFEAVIDSKAEEPSSPETNEVKQEPIFTEVEKESEKTEFLGVKNETISPNEAQEETNELNETISAIGNTQGDTSGDKTMDAKTLAEVEAGNLMTILSETTGEILAVPIHVESVVVDPFLICDEQFPDNISNLTEPCGEKQVESIENKKQLAISIKRLTEEEIMRLTCRKRLASSPKEQEQNTPDQQKPVATTVEVKSIRNVSKRRKPFIEQFTPIVPAVITRNSLKKIEINIDTLEGDDKLKDHDVKPAVNVKNGVIKVEEKDCKMKVEVSSSPTALSKVKNEVKSAKRVRSTSRSSAAAVVTTSPATTRIKPRRSSQPTSTLAIKKEKVPKPNRTQAPKSKKLKMAKSSDSKTKELQLSEISKVVKAKSNPPERRESVKSESEYSEESELEPSSTEDEDDDEDSDFEVSVSELHKDPDDDDSDLEATVRESRDIKPVIVKLQPWSQSQVVTIRNDTPFNSNALTGFDPWAVDPLDLGPEQPAQPQPIQILELDEPEFVDLVSDSDGESSTKEIIPELPPSKRQKNSESKQTVTRHVAEKRNEPIRKNSFGLFDLQNVKRIPIPETDQVKQKKKHSSGNTFEFRLEGNIKLIKNVVRVPTLIYKPQNATSVIGIVDNSSRDNIIILSKNNEPVKGSSVQGTTARIVSSSSGNKSVSHSHLHPHQLEGSVKNLTNQTTQNFGPPKFKSNPGVLSITESSSVINTDECGENDQAESIIGIPTEDEEMQIGESQNQEARTINEQKEINDEPSPTSCHDIDSFDSPSQILEVLPQQRIGEKVPLDEAISEEQTEAIIDLVEDVLTITPVLEEQASTCEQNQLSSDEAEASSPYNKIDLPLPPQEVEVLEISQRVQQHLLFQTWNEQVGIQYITDLETALATCCKENNYGSKRGKGKKRPKGKLYSTMKEIRKAAEESDDGCPFLEPMNINQNPVEDHSWRGDCPPVLDCCE